jgi:hypothetical protein
MSKTITLADRFEHIKKLINHDIDVVKIIPSSVRSFSELHDYVDANEYLPVVIPDIEFKLFTEDDNGEQINSEWTDIANAVMDEADKWLRNGRKDGNH